MILDGREHITATTAAMGWPAKVGTFARCCNSSVRPITPWSRSSTSARLHQIRHAAIRSLARSCVRRALFQAWHLFCGCGHPGSSHHQRSSYRDCPSRNVSLQFEPETAYGSLPPRIREIRPYCAASSCHLITRSGAAAASADRAVHNTERSCAQSDQRQTP